MEEALRRHYLRAMGIELWEQRPALRVAQSESAVVTETAVSVEGAVEVTIEPSPPVDAQVQQVEPPGWWDEVPMPDTERAATLEPDGGAARTASEGVATLDWEALQRRVAGCERCPLHASRSNTVFGVGDRAARLMVIGEAPGAEEDRKGEPFVGRAGKLLDAMLLAIGLQRSQVFIANILKCRPPDNRDPRPEEALSCEAYLQRQVALVQPQVILAVGRIAAQNLLQSQEAVGRLRGGEHRYRGIPVVVSYHPAYLLRSPEQKARSWQDLQRAARLLRE
ncbi:MAG: uracil-DNA glycosylase [Gammaproteobacteria bacterium]|nr:uracil-DNA glycosylase [Gammaproteobacteria bacterium]